MQEESVVGEEMYLEGGSDIHHRIRFRMSIPIQTSWSRRSHQTKRIYWYQLHRHPRSTDQQPMVFPKVEVPEVVLQLN